MAGTRSSSRLSGQGSNASQSPQQDQGKKRRQPSEETAPSASQDGPKDSKKQKTLEETIGLKAETGGKHHDEKKGESTAPEADENQKASSKEKAVENGPRNGESSQSTKDPVLPTSREEVVPSSILEKGIIYFFFRGRVNINDPSNVDDLARSYMVLRPLPHGAKLSDGPMSDQGTNRLLALPKKVLPQSGRDKFMVFVEKAGVSFKELKDSFLTGEDYDTKTAGTRHTPAATPIGEGVYAITTTGRESHLAYILTIPAEVGKVQKDVGLQERGSFVLSTKNPSYPSPANASLPEGPKFPQDILDDFRSLRWSPTKPPHLDYANAQVLVIGEDRIEKAVEPQEEDQKEDKEDPLEEMEKLEGEDEIRVKHLDGNDAIFADLRVGSDDLFKLQTTW